MEWGPGDWRLQPGTPSGSVLSACAAAPPVSCSRPAAQALLAPPTGGAVCRDVATGRVDAVHARQLRLPCVLQRGRSHAALGSPRVSSSGSSSEVIPGPRRSWHRSPASLAASAAFPPKRPHLGSASGYRRAQHRWPMLCHSAGLKLAPSCAQVQPRPSPHDRRCRCSLAQDRASQGTPLPLPPRPPLPLQPRAGPRVTLTTPRVRAMPESSSIMSRDARPGRHHSGHRRPQTQSRPVVVGRATASTS